MYGWRSGLAAIATSVCLILTLAKAAPAQVAPKVESVQIPPNVDPFDLSFDDIKKYSSMKNFELVGHSYFKVPQRTDFAKAIGRPDLETGSGFNTGDKIRFTIDAAKATVTSIQVIESAK